MRILIFLIIAISINVLSNAQFERLDVTDTIEGLSDEYEKKFRTYVFEVPELLNKYEVSTTIKPVKLHVFYSEETSFIRITANFDSEEIFAESKYKQHQVSINRYHENVISVYLINELMSVISEYKMKVSKPGFSIDMDIMNFINAVRLVKENGDWVQFHSYNEIEAHGYFPFYYYSKVFFQIDGESYDLDALDINALNQLRIFGGHKLVGMDGKNTSYYHLLKFFGLEKDHD